MAVDTLVELAFPLAGIHESNEFQEQPNGTSAEALNVRSRDLNTRDRGGTRPGLSRFIDAPVAALDSPVQMLDTVVNTGEAFLSGNYQVPYETFNDNFVLDPSDGIRNPGWAVRIGGSAIQPNRNVSNTEGNAPEDDDEGVVIPGEITAGGINYTVSILPFGQRTVTNVGENAIPDGQAVIVIKSGLGYFTAGGA